MKISQELYAAATVACRNYMAKALAPGSDLAKLCLAAKAVPPKEWSLDHPLIKRAGREYMKMLMKAGVTSSMGFNFYDLRGPAYFLFPLNTPFIQDIPRQGKVNAGVGTTAHWKATKNPNSTYIYGGVKEGQRGPTATPDEFDYFATYKELGMEGGETFTAQWAGEGYTDNLADEHFRNLARLRLQEEMMTLWGNSGPYVAGSLPASLPTGNLGLALGQPTTPNVDASGTAGNLATGTNVYVSVVAITPMGVNPGGQAGYNAPPTVGTGLTSYTTRQNADGSSMNVNGGISQMSNVSSAGTTNSSGSVVATTTAKAGAVAYAWFWNVNALSTTADLTLGAITPWPTYTIKDLPPAGGFLANNISQTVDHSYQTTDFDGLGTYTWNQGSWTDMNGGTFTPAGNGIVAEIEADLAALYESFQAQPDAIWCSVDVRESLDQAMIFSNLGTNSFIFTSAGQGDRTLTGGFVFTGYKSKYSINPEGSAVIPIRLHPMFPKGTLLYDIKTNPYPHSRIPGVRQFLTQRDYYAIEWPVVTRQWTFGTYVHEVLAHYVPWITAIRTGIGPFVAPSLIP